MRWEKIAQAIQLEEVFKEWFKKLTISTLLTFSPFKHRITVHLALHLLPEIVRSISHRSLYHGICFPHILQLCSPTGVRQVFMSKVQRPQSPDPRDIPPVFAWPGHTQHHSSVAVGSRTPSYQNSVSSSQGEQHLFLTCTKLRRCSSCFLNYPSNAHIFPPIWHSTVASCYWLRFKSYFHLETVGKMGKNPENVGTLRTFFMLFHFAMAWGFFVSQFFAHFL